VLIVVTGQFLAEWAEWVEHSFESQEDPLQDDEYHDQSPLQHGQVTFEHNFSRLDPVLAEWAEWVEHSFDLDSCHPVPDLGERNYVQKLLDHAVMVIDHDTRHLAEDLPEIDHPVPDDRSRDQSYVQPIQPIQPETGQLRRSTRIKNPSRAYID
jgi:hypothetical protein